ncbi:MAG TPA: AbgT family transporter [Bradyrhizobium sp.]|nr:AbgT family transporter [Bradyrhizobium sp.]
MEAAMSKTMTQKILDTVERVGNSVPHPIVIFLSLIVLVLVISHLLYMLGATVTYQVINPDTHKIETATTAANSLLTAEGVRHIYTRLVPNFLGFSAVGLLVVAMVGVGVAEEAGLVNALIRKLVAVSPSGALVYIIAFVGILSSIAADAGYVVLIPLAGAAFLSVGRHPIAGLAVGFAAVAGAFNVNMIIKPLDAVLTEITNDAIHMVNPTISLDLTANLLFSIVAVLVLTVIIALVSERIIEPRLGTYNAGAAAVAQPGQDSKQLSADESRGLRYAAFALLAVVIVFVLLTVPSGAPLRNPTTGVLIGNSPFMNGLIGVIMVLFLATGIAYGIGAKTMNGSADVIAAMTKAVGSLGGTILLFVVISQFVDYFNYSNIPTLMALTMADALKSAHIAPLWLLLGFIIVVTILNFIFTPAIAKWAIFAPVFVPLFVQLAVDPAAVLAAYRVGDSPTNSITPLNAYFAMVVGFAQNYDKNAGVGTVVALMLPYALCMAVIWTLLFVVWYLLGLPWGI